MRPLRTAAPQLALLLAVTVAVLGVGALPAGAHGAEGELTLTKAEQTGPTTVEVEVGIVYANDGHLAESAAVTATLTGPDGATVGPVELTRTGETTSLYAATVDVTAVGEWSVAVTSSEPAGATSGSVTVVEGFTPATTTPEVPTTDATPATEAPAPVAAVDEAPATEEASADGAIGDGDGFPSAAIIGASLALFAVVIIGGVLVARRRERADAAGDAVDP
jgi:hypothetical protein